jgi:hypothetical protein
MTTTSRVAPCTSTIRWRALKGRCVRKDVIQRRRHVSPVVGMLVGQDKAGGRGDRSGFVAVDVFDLGGPFPTFVGEVEAPGADGLRCPAGDGLLDGHAVGGVGWRVAGRYRVWVGSRSGPMWGDPWSLRVTGECHQTWYSS